MCLLTAGEDDAPAKGVPALVVDQLRRQQQIKGEAQVGAARRPRLLILNDPARRLWIGGIVRSDGVASPVLRQMRVDYGRDTYLEFLPAIYREDDRQRDLLERLLSLEQSVLGRVEDEVTDLTQLFDPFAAPSAGFPSWLHWLAGWLAFELEEHWTDAEARSNLAEAFTLYGKRGTPDGLRRYLKLYAGVEARIEEPAMQTELWSLGENSTLGLTTMLAPAHPKGAVLGATTTLDRSHMTRGYGAAMFDDLAHLFCVEIYCAELSRRGAVEDAWAVLNREKPAHTVYHLCTIEPRMRVGAQSRVAY